MNNWSTVQSKVLIGRKHLKVKMSMIRFIAFAWNASRFAIACVLLVLMTLPTLSGISGNAEQKTILQTTEQQMQCTVLELQFWSFKYMAVIRIRKIWATFHSYSCDTRREQCVDINSPLQTVFKHLKLYSYT